MDFLSTGCHGIDELLDGGLPVRQISLLYGEAGTGKTILATQCALEAVRKASKVFYLDADQSFSANRIDQLGGSSELAERIVLFRPEDFKEQGRIVESVENLLTKSPTLLVIDSVTGLYRAGQIKPEGFFARDRELNRQLAQLDALSSRFPIWILLTGQVHSAPSGGDWLVEPVATRTLRHWSDVILRLCQNPRPSVRDCILEKKNGVDASHGHCLFRITERGIEDA